MSRNVDHFSNGNPPVFHNLLYAYPRASSQKQGGCDNHFERIFTNQLFLSGYLLEYTTYLETTRDKFIQIEPWDETPKHI